MSLLPSSMEKQAAAFSSSELRQCRKSSFWPAHTSLENNMKEMKMKEVEFKEKEEELRKKMVELLVKEDQNEERRNAVEEEESRVWKRSLEVDEREKEVLRRFEAVELIVRLNDERCCAIQSKDDQIVKRCLALERREKEIEERFAEVDLKERGIEERFEAVESKKRGSEECFQAVESKERRVEERFVVVESKEKEIEERFVMVESKEKEIEERFVVVESKEKEIEERFVMVESKEKEIEERFVMVESKEKKIEERFVKVELKKKEIEERLQELHSKEKGIEERFQELDLKEKGIEERFEELDMKEKGIEERFGAVELREKSIEEGLLDMEAKKGQMEDGFLELKSRKEQIDKCCKDVELREKRIEEFSRAVKLEEDKVGKRCAELLRKEKELHERSQKLDFKDKQVDWCLQDLELKKKRIDERREALELWEREVNEGRPAPEWGESQVRIWCSEMESKQKQIEGLLRDLALKETQMNERSQALDLKERLVDEHCMAEELRERETDERCEEIELEKRRIKEPVMELERREIEISARLREVELKESVMEERSRALDLKEKDIDGLNEDVELKRKGISDQRRGLVFEENRISRVRMELDRRKRELELKDKKLNEDIDSLKAKERQIDNRLLELNLKELKMKEINAGFEELEVKKKLVKEYSHQINLLDKLIKEKGLGLEFREKLISRSLTALELKEKQNHEHSEALKLRQNEIEKKALALKVKEKEFNKLCQENESREKVITDDPVIENKRLCNDLRVDDGETLQLLLNDRVDEHCFMGEAILKALKSYNDPPALVLSALNGFFPPHLRKGNVVYTARTVRSSCVLLLEQLMNVRPEVCKNVREKAEDISCLWRRKMQENGESRIVVLGFLLLVVAFRLTPQFERDELKRLWEIVDQHRLAPQLRFELDLFEECEENDVFTQPEIGQHHSGSVVTDDLNLCGDIQSGCSNMDANCLRSYLNKHVMDHKLFPQKIVDALKSAPDPAMLVYKVLQTFNLPQSSTVNKTSCIFLLEQLLKLQKHQSGRNPLGKIEQVLNPPLQISQDMRINALAFASRWKRRLTQDGLKPLEVYGFLQFLVSYKLGSIYDGDELLQLFKVLYDALPVYWPEESLHLCRALGLTKKIPGLIKSLIKEDRRLQAAKYICTFMEEHHFPLALLLKDHVKFTRERVEKIRWISKDKSTEKIKATFELSHLREVLQYIKEYKLEQEYLPTDLESRIKQLEAILADLNTVPTEASEKPTKLPVIKMKKDGAKVDSPEKMDETVKNHSSARSDSELDSHGVTKRYASTPISEFAEQGKRFRVEALMSPVRPNITFKIPSHKNPFSLEKPQAMLPRQLLQSCPPRPAGKASPIEHPAQRLETSPTRMSTPGAVYNAAVAPYGGGHTQNTKQQPEQHFPYGYEYPGFPKHGIFPGQVQT